MVREVFGLTQREAATGRESQPQRNAAGGVGAAFVDSTRMQPRSYPGGFVGRWVWSAEPTQRVYFKAVWHGPADAKYDALVFCDNEGAIFINGEEIARGFDYQKGWAGTIGLKDGDVITIDARDYNDGRMTAGLFFALVKDGRTIFSAQDLRYSLARPDAGWRTDRDLSGLAKPDTENVHELHRGARPLPVEAVVNTINASIERDFVPAKPCHVLHRKVGPRDVFMVTRAAGTECFFRARGSAELWDPWTGQVRPLRPTKVTSAGTSLTVPSDGAEAHLIVFTPGEPGPSRRSRSKAGPSQGKRSRSTGRGSSS